MPDANAAGAPAAIAALSDWRLRLRQTWTPSDFDQLWRTLFGEARGEPLEGQIAVAWVILNRADIARDYLAQRKRAHLLYGAGTIAGVCMVASQFSCWNRGTPSRARCSTALIGAPETARAIEVAAAVLLGDHAAPFDEDVTHYHVVTDPFPSGWTPKPLPAGWIQPMPVKVIGGHAFYRAP